MLRITKEELQDSNLSLRDLLMRGSVIDTIKPEKTLKKVEITPQQARSGVHRINDRSRISPHITYKKLLASIRRIGGEVDFINLTGGNSNLGVHTLDCKSTPDNEQEMPSQTPDNEEFQVIQLHNIGRHIKILGVTGLNVLLLTTEGHRLRRSMSTENIDDGRAWILENGLKIKSETPVSLFHLDGPSIRTETVAFVIEQ